VPAILSDRRVEVFEMERNPRTLGIERPPVRPLPVGFKPAGGSPYSVQDGDSWVSLAGRWGVDAKSLIDFNFKTNDPAEVNWYLSHWTGCNQATPDGFNWAFSANANPNSVNHGVIYRPPIDFDADVISAGPSGLNALARYLDGLPEEDETLDWVHFGLDVFEFVHMAIGIFEIGEGTAAAFLVEVVGPFAAELAVLLAIGVPYMQVIDERKREWALRGISEGTVMGANRVPRQFIRSYFVHTDPNYFNDRGQNPEHYREFQIAYTLYLWKGYAYGLQLNNPERVKLMARLIRQEGRWSDDEIHNFDSWSDRAKKDFYERTGIQFHRSFLPPK